MRVQVSKDLQKILYKFTSTSETIFTKKLDDWHEPYKDFLNEKTLNKEYAKKNFIHAKLVSVYRRLRTNWPYLFRHKKHKHLKIQNTTNGLDAAVFSLMKKLLKTHNGFTKSLYLKDIYSLRSRQVEHGGRLSSKLLEKVII